ncbi:OmpH family outer membrane protein [Paracoccus sp. TOH]|uniref:OmpH family outer membrane protein n=1 Tax=Paracoccus sp. TOH TaxID=1263728 RepID=UPI0025B25F37|nr:OmpH family outer membrane protein [Paracoccus sp. TOH]WJS85622.1 OmpH family outer membrane protein [Paracoccus sp. TOH]
MMRGRGIAAWGLAVLLAVPTGVSAQQPSPEPVPAPRAPAGTDDHAVPPMVVETPPSEGEGVLPVLTLDQETLYARSKWGQRVQGELELRGREIAAENDRLADQFAAEEQQLTVLRQTLPADEFRKRADEFDKRVVEVRRARDAAARELQVSADEERQAFFRAVLPVLAKLMQERGAVAVLDQRAIFVASQSIDITEALIERMDSTVGAGPVEPEAPSDPAPADRQQSGSPQQPGPDLPAGARPNADEGPTPPEPGTSRQPQPDTPSGREDSAAQPGTTPEPQQNVPATNDAEGAGD